MIKEELLLFVEIEDSCHDLCRPGPGDWSRREEGSRGPKSRVKQGALFAKTHVSISSYKAALGSKNIEQKQSQANKNLERAREHSIS